MGKTSFIDLAGQTFFRLTAIRRDGSYRGSATWECRCACGTLVNGVLSGNLRRGNSKSCGCLSKDQAPQRCTHGLSKTPTHNSWRAMIERCKNPNTKGYCNYGGRGIKVCERWEKFENFYEDMGARPEGLTLDRIDVDGDYTPENCRWVSMAEQQLNKRNTARVEYLDVSYTLEEASKVFGVPKLVIKSRLKEGWGVERALTTPNHATRKDAVRLEHMGASYTIDEAAAAFGIKRQTLANRLFLGWSAHDALTRPVRKQPASSKPHTKR